MASAAGPKGRFVTALGTRTPRASPLESQVKRLNPWLFAFDIRLGSTPVKRECGYLIVW